MPLTLLPVTVEAVEMRQRAFEELCINSDCCTYDFGGIVL